jgi:hypothetical protein
MPIHEFISATSVAQKEITTVTAFNYDERVDAAYKNHSCAHISCHNAPLTLCVSANIAAGSLSSYAECCWIAAKIATPMFGGTTFSAAITTPCTVSDGACVPRSAPRTTIVAFGQDPSKKPPFHGRTVPWLPEFAPSNVVIAGRDQLFCVPPNAPIRAHYTAVSSGDTVNVFGQSFRGYPGTCLRPQLFRKGFVYPPDALGPSNATAHYCNGAYPQESTPFENDHTSGALTFCHNDPLGPADRKSLCSGPGSEILLGRIIRPRSTISEACDLEAKRCVLIPGDTYSQVTDVVAAGVDIEHFTFVLLDVSITTLQMLVIGARALDIVVETDPLLAPMRAQSSVLLNLTKITTQSLADDSDAIEAAFCGSAFVTDSVIAALDRVLSAHWTGHNYSFVGPNALAQTLDSVHSPITAKLTTISAPYVTVKGAQSRPTVLRPEKPGCTLFAVVTHGFAASNIIFNQTDCTDPPITFNGEFANNTRLTNLLVINAPAAALFTGGVSQNANWITAKTLDTTGSVVENVTFAYNTAYTGDNSYASVVLGATTGTFVIVGTGAPPVQAVDTSQTPQLACSKGNFAAVCVKPNNSLGVFLDISVCGKGCSSPSATLNNGVACNQTSEIARTQIIVADCSALTPQNFTNHDAVFVNRVGIGCNVAFKYTSAHVRSCADRARVHKCDDVEGEPDRCRRYHDDHFYACRYDDGGACQRGTSCAPVVVTASSTPNGLIPAQSGAPLNGPLSRQQWFAARPQNGGPSFVYSSDAAHTNIACLGGCAIEGSCSPNACPSTGSPFRCISDSLMSAPCGAHPHIMLSTERAPLFITTLALDSDCIALTGSTLSKSNCNSGRSVEWLLTQVASQNNYDYFHISRPESPYDCISVAKNNTLVLAPCTPCSVGPADTVKTQNSQITAPDVHHTTPLHTTTIAVKVSDRANILLDPTDPSRCLTLDETAFTPCGRPADWSPLPLPPNAVPVGVGALLYATAPFRGTLLALKCDSPLPNNTSIGSTKLDCGQNTCTAKGSSANFTLGQIIVFNHITCSAIVDHIIIQPALNFTVAAIGSEIVNITDLLGLFGTPYEHAVFHTPPTHSALIWGSVAAVWITALVGTITCCTAYAAS